MRALVCASDTLEQLELAQCIGLQSLALRLPSLKMLGISATPGALRVYQHGGTGDSEKAPLCLPSLRHVDATLRRTRGEGPDAVGVLRSARCGRGLVVKTSIDITAAQRKTQHVTAATRQQAHDATVDTQRRMVAPADVAEQVEEIKRKLAQTDLSSAERFALRRALNIKLSRAALAPGAEGKAGSGGGNAAGGGVTRRRAPTKREVPPWRKPKSTGTGTGTGSTSSK